MKGTVTPQGVYGLLSRSRTTSSSARPASCSPGTGTAGRRVSDSPDSGPPCAPGELWSLRGHGSVPAAEKRVADASEFGVKNADHGTASTTRACYEPDAEPVVH